VLTMRLHAEVRLRLLDFKALTDFTLLTHRLPKAARCKTSADTLLHLRYAVIAASLITGLRLLTTPGW
jgi:hypothetical protein